MALPSAPRHSLPSNVAIDVAHVTVAYRRYERRPTSLKESIVRLFRERRFRYHTTFDAVHDATFSVNKGGVHALIGTNGSGKSTLLKVIAGVLRPTKGKVTVLGKVASLIELGAGFDPELTAEENIYLHGSLYKLSRRRIAERVEHVLDFAELREFASTPIKYFSSGMFARLGFSVAIDIDPDVLLVDEILGVGDDRFQAKCKDVFDNFLKQGKTILLVSHDMGTIRGMSTSATVLSRGRMLYTGEPEKAIEIYHSPDYQSALQ